MFCRICGNELKEGSAFCSMCGTPVKSKIQKQDEVKTDNVNNGEKNQEENKDNNQTIRKIDIKESNTPVKPVPVSNVQNKNESKETESQEDDNQEESFNPSITYTTAADVSTKVQEGIRSTVGTVKGTAGTIKNSLDDLKSPDVSEEKKKSTKTKIAVVAAVVVLFVVLMVVETVTRSINLNDYLVVTFSGYNSIGEASATIDYRKLSKDYRKKLKYKGSSKPIDELESLVSFDISQTDSLSNGDKIEVTWNIPEDSEDKFNYKIKYTNAEYVVEGLQDVAIFDAFEGITVDYGGISPNGYAEINTENSKYDLDYSLDKNDSLSNGDIVTVTVSCNYSTDKSAFVNYLNMVPETITKEFTVDGLGNFITSVSELKEQTLDSMQNQALDVIKAYVADSYTSEEKYKSAKYIGGYVIFAKSIDNSNEKNDVFLVYKINNTIKIEDSNYKGKISYYYYVQFKDVQVTPNGENIVDLMNYTTPYDQVSIDVKYGSDDWDSKSFYYKGYKSTEDLKAAVIDSRLAEYTVEEIPGAENEETSETEKDESYEEENKADDETTNDKDEYYFPESDSKYLSEKDIEGMSKDDIELALNELYARHGRKFAEARIKEYFESKKWYNGTIEPEDFSESVFNEYEIANRDLMVAYMKKKGYR